MKENIQNSIDHYEHLPLYPMRILVVQTMYSVEIIKKRKDINDIASDYIEFFLSKYLSQNLNKDFYYNLLLFTNNNLSNVDNIISANLDRTWRLERLPKLVLAILRVGMGEILEGKYSNFANIINDYLQITKSLKHSEKIGFINSILDRVANNVYKKNNNTVC